MKLLVYLQTKYGILGISSVQNVQMQARNCLAPLLIVHISITSLVYLLTEAKTIPEFVDSFYTLTNATVNAFCLIFIIAKMKHIFQLIDDLEEAIGQRNQQAIYNKWNKRIEQFSKSFHFFYARCTFAGVVIPNILKTLVVFFTANLGSDTFQLPFLAS